MRTRTGVARCCCDEPGGCCCCSDAKIPGSFEVTFALENSGICENCADAIPGIADALSGTFILDKFATDDFLGGDLARCIWRYGNDNFNFFAPCDLTSINLSVACGVETLAHVVGNIPLTEPTTRWRLEVFIDGQVIGDLEQVARYELFSVPEIKGYHCKNPSLFLPVVDCYTDDNGDPVTLDLPNVHEAGCSADGDATIIAIL